MLWKGRLSPLRKVLASETISGMGIRESDFKWTLRQFNDVVSWTGISWFVALLAGTWGVMVGIGAFLPAYILLALCLTLCAIKWGHVTRITDSNPHRRIPAFIFGVLLLAALGVYTGLWIHGRKLKADEDVKKLEPLAQIPDLVSQVKQIPLLKKQLDELPRMKQTIAELQTADTTANDETKKKQLIIEGLAQTVISQQKQNSEKSHSDLQHTESVLATNINTYRIDTNSAVAKIMRPGRTLGDKRSAFISALKIGGARKVAITPAHGSREALDFSEEISSAFKEAGWEIVPTEKLAFMVKDGVGVQLLLKKFNVPEGTFIPNSELTPTQVEVASAFHAISMDIVPYWIDKGENGVTELYVGLQ